MSAKEDLLNEFKELEDSCNRNNTQPGIAIEPLLFKYIKDGYYNEVFEFLGELIFTTDRNRGRLYITEYNMYLYQMLEIYFLEVGNPTVTTPIFSRYPSVESFRDICTILHLGIRRIWFQFPDNGWRQDFSAYLNTHSITAEQLAVITKYTVPEDMLRYTIKELSTLLPMPISEFINYYGNGMEEHGYIYRLPDDFLLNTTPELLPVTELDASNPVKLHKKDIDCHKIAVIFCKNNERYAKEVCEYVSCITLPDSFSLEIISVINASSMAAGYNYAMKYSDAKYKFYIHQDTFLICSSLFIQYINAFNSNSNLGLLGIAGCTNLPSHGKWWDNENESKRARLYQDAIMTLLRSKSIVTNGIWEPADALDGILLATAYDVPWREDIFDGWHFYDISQCYEFRNAGYITGILNPDEMFLLHETTMKKDPKDLYEKYRRIFVENYMTD